MADAEILLFSRADVDVAGAIGNVDETPVLDRVGRVVGFEDAVVIRRTRVRIDGRNEELQHLRRQTCDRERASQIVPARAAPFEEDHQILGRAPLRPEAEARVSAREAGAHRAMLFPVGTDHRRGVLVLDPFGRGRLLRHHLPTHKRAGQDCHDAPPKTACLSHLLFSCW